MDLLYYYLPFLETIKNFLDLGGPVVRVIGILTLFMWVLIIERLVYMRVGHPGLVRKTHQIWDARSDHSSWKAKQIRQRLISVVSRHAASSVPQTAARTALPVSRQP